MPQEPAPLWSLAEAKTRADARCRRIRHKQETLDLIESFVKQFRLRGEVQLGLRMLPADTVNRVTKDISLSVAMSNTADPTKVILTYLRSADPEAATIVQVLVDAHDSSSDGSRSRSRHRRSSHSHRAADCPSGSSVSDSESSSSRTARPPEDTGDAEELRKWLLSLDGGRGALERYLQPLRVEFGDLQALHSAVLPASKCKSNSLVGRIDPAFWDALDVRALGHQLLFSKGILVLTGQL